MSLNDQFDELARQKLDERAFPFNEGAWQQAQRVITAQKRSSRKPFWYLGGAAAVGLALWLLWPSDGASLVAEQHRVESTTEAAAMPTVEQEPSNMNVRTEAARDEAAQVRSESNAAGHPADVTSSPDSKPMTSRPKRPLIASNSATADQPKVQFTISHTTGSDEHPAGPVQNGKEQAPQDLPAQEAAMADGAKPEEPQGSSGDANEAGEEGLAFSANVKDNVAPQTLAPEEGEDHALSEEKASQPLGISSSPQEAELDQQEGAVDVPAHDPATADSAQAAPTASATTLPSDSAAAAMPEPVIAPLVGPRSPWEISLLAGAFSTASKYVLPQVKEWTTTPEPTVGYAAEAVRMGRNFGFGLGLHYGTYADRISTPEETRTDVAYSRYWFLQGVDTTILIITGGDSASGYTGINVNTTVQVLRSAYDTTSTTTLIRAARTQLVRTSYVELPLLLDAHLVQGRWSIGVRGGPTVGMLTARSGALPGSSDDGYTDLGGMAVRQTIFGWTARAYVRYRFNSAWSVGIEPAARGQFTDAIDDQGARRRSNALGAMISLSYRLR